ncbi:ABC transporter ATP-binding protein [Candidatus Bathyarchaeota archaeon]|nr:ABC transporter ATP-binding protein [Candidatus Bathyarchaeota archaeon]
MNLLEIENLQVKVKDQTILKDINLTLRGEEVYVLFGPNGSGKTTLINAIIGIPSQKVSGKIKFMGEDITKKTVDERAKLGISVGFQNPPEIAGIKLADVLKLCLNKSPKDEFSNEEKQQIKAFNLTGFLNRDFNVDFSGGERKRAEILQMMFLKSKLLILDEPDSGVDIESLKLVGHEIQRYIEETKSSALIVTHQGGILEFLDAKHACVLLESKIHCFPEPKKILKTLKTKGYKECIECQERVTEGW